MTEPRPPRFDAKRVCHATDALGAAVDDADAVASAELVDDGEIVILLLRPSPLFVLLAALGGVTLLLLLTLALAAAARLPGVFWTEGQALAVGALAIAARLTWQAMEWWSHVYVLTDRRVMRRSGVLRVVMFEAPLRRIQHTAIAASVRERLFGLGSLGFATAGTGGYEMFWLMVERPERVHRIVTEAIDRYGRR